MITVTQAIPGDAALFAAFEQATDTREFIIPYPENDHDQRMNAPDLRYLRILDAGSLAGFFILGLDPDGQSVEFRRIVVSRKGGGIGQLAITAMEEFCRTQLGRFRIWLDVFADNARGRHIYEKLGYERYGEAAYENRLLLLYQKNIPCRDETPSEPL